MCSGTISAKKGIREQIGNLFTGFFFYLTISSIDNIVKVEISILDNKSFREDPERRDDHEDKKTTVSEISI